MMTLGAVVFDLDGVLTDTAEYHFLAWKRLADEEGLPFERADNEALRGISRLQSLRHILKDRPVSEERLQELMARKNGYYQAMLEQVTPDDLLPGVPDLLDTLDAASIPYAVASASRNAETVVRRLGIAERLSLIANGLSVARQKPAPDLFRYAAAKLDVPPSQCLVVEDAAAGVRAALAAGMPALALGPSERFVAVGEGPEGRFIRRDSLEGVTLEELRAAVESDTGWLIKWVGFDAETLAHMETVFTTGNGYFSSRGSFEEGYPGESALTFAHGIFDDVPIFYTELVNLPHWFDFRFQVDGQTFRLDRGQVELFRYELHMLEGVVRRQVRWQSPDGAILDITFERFASYRRPHVGAMRAIVTAVNRPVRLAAQTSVNGHVTNDMVVHWQHFDQGQTDDGRQWLYSRTRRSDIELATAFAVAAPGAERLECLECPGQPSFSWEMGLEPGHSMQADKLVAYASSRDPEAGEGDVSGRALEQLDDLDYDSLLAEHVAAWNEVWGDIDVIIEGDEEAQLCLRYNLYQLQIAAPRRDDRVSIGAKTLSGLGYRGHVFWDTEVFMLPYFTLTQPAVARDLLKYRYHTLPGARRKAATNGYGGAQFAWESAATGDEVTPPWVPDFSGGSTDLVRIWTGDIEIHITADVAYAIMQYWQATGDDVFMRDYGAEIILDSACFWGDRVEAETVDGRRQYALRDVIGPDEYHEHVDNNAFTNRMVKWHLQAAVKLVDWLRSTYPERASELSGQLGLNEACLGKWQDIISHIVVPFDPQSRLITQFEGFFEREPVDWSAYGGRTESIQALLGIEGANQSQVIKQADVIMLLCLLRDEFDQSTWQINWDTYMPLTDHRYGSSLGPSFHAWAACEMNQPDVAYDHFMLAARVDLCNVRGNAGDGIHAASAGGLWQAAVFGFAGLRLKGEGYTLEPRLPSHWRRLAFKFYQHGRQQFVDIREGGGGLE